ncbi:hypothetical protein [Ascidiimonas sp. W6]|uniref:hypothetical protein n=1 Tax=Ascidiimonas meishanensis TaxID=3128903 RepID=UPI0030EEC7F2
MKILRLYLKQRFKPVIFGALTLLLILFSVAHSLTNSQVFLFILPVFLFLGMLRLYDDLMNYQVDVAKPNRIYTQPKSRNLLALILAGFAFFCSLVLFLLHPISAGVLVSFLVLNDLMYRLLFNRGIWRHFLPLFKYPMVVGFLYFLSTAQFSSLEITGLMVSIFCAFIVFEQLDDTHFPIARKYKGLFANLSLIALLIAFIDLQFWWVSIAVLVSGNLVVRLNHKSTPYLFLAFVLVSKLVLETLA